MSDATDEIDELREKRRQELTDQLEGGSTAETAGTPDEPVYVNGTAEFEDLLAEYDTVFVDFYADWCGPCKMLEPIVEDLAAETDAAVAKVDVDRNQQLAGRFGVQGIPTMIVFAGGEPAERVVGVRDKSALAALIEGAAAN
ncbi:MAG: thioredoxin [Haloferacaceae archaeon]